MGDRLATLGFVPVEDLPCPSKQCFLRLGPGRYTTGFCNDEHVWLNDHNLPIYPTHGQLVPEC